MSEGTERGGQDSGRTKGMPAGTLEQLEGIVGLVPIEVEWTDEEKEAMNKEMKAFGRAADAKVAEVGNGGEGKKLYVHPKAHDAMLARGLVSYAQKCAKEAIDAGRGSERSSELLGMALRAQLKAYGLHNLPEYFFYAALMLEASGDDRKSRKWFKLFLKMQRDFKPDSVDATFLETFGSNINAAVAVARRKTSCLRSLLSMFGVRQ
jgi:hypothetical protein